MINELTYIAIIVILSASASVFICANPARKNNNFKTSLNYFSLFYALSALAFTSFALSTNINKLYAVFSNNFLFVAAFLCLLQGFKQRYATEHKLIFVTKEFWLSSLSVATLNVALYLGFPEEVFLRIAVLLSSIVVIVILSFHNIARSNHSISYGEQTARITLFITALAIILLILFLVLTRNVTLYFSLLTIVYSSMLVMLMGAIQTMFLSDFADMFKHQSNTDFLTGLHNRRYFMNTVQEYLNLSKRTQKNSSLIMLDIDDFKFINDVFGHDIGDRVLENVADILVHTIRDSDICARIGGEEFAVFMPNSDQEGACLLAERIKEKAIALTTPSHICDVKISLSFGVCEIGPGAELLESIKHADRALYFAKENGKNQVCNYDRIKDMETQFQ